MYNKWLKSQKDHLFSDTAWTRYQHRGGKCVLLNHRFPTDATQPQSSCFICNFSISWGSPASAISRQTKPAYGRRRACTHTDVPRGYLTVCQLVLGWKEKAVCRGGWGEKWPTRRYVCLPDLIFTYCQQQGVKLMRLFRGPITSNPCVL